MHISMDFYLGAMARGTDEDLLQPVLEGEDAAREPRVPLVQRHQQLRLRRQHHAAPKSSAESPTHPHII